MPLDLTIVIPVRNEAFHLPNCLKAIGKNFASRVVVIDSVSTDETASIAQSWGAEVIQFSWDGRFPKKRNWFLRHHTPSTKWVLFLDADEYLTTEFKNELSDKLNGNAPHNGYILCYSIFFMGRKMRGGYALKKPALFKVGAGEYEHIPEQCWSNLDMEIHEHPIIEGSMGIIKSKIEHREDKNILQYWEKHLQYASWEANRFMDYKMTKKSKSNQWFIRQRIKYCLMDTPMIGPVFFIGSYFLMGGFLNGYRGLAFGVLKMAYFTLVYCKIQELKREII